MEKAVLLSVHPQWCERIADGGKTIEVRKTKPKLDTPFKVYIYCTNNKDMLWILKESERESRLKITSIFTAKDVGGATKANGKVIGEFVCDKIFEIEYRCGSYRCKGLTVLENDRVASASKLSLCDLRSYLSCNNGYGWHISNLVIYDKPVELYKFHRECERPECEDCSFFHFENTPNSYEGWCECDEKISIKRPPQSWCYVSDTGINTSKGEN